MAIKYDLYKNPPAAGSVKKTRLHARLSSIETVNLKDLGKDIESASSFSRSDWVGALELLRHTMMKEFKRGRRIYIEGIGYFKPTLSCPDDVKNAKDIRAESIGIKSIAYTPDKNLISELNTAKFIRKSGKHTKQQTESKLEELIFNYINNNGSITRKKVETLCEMTRSSAYRYIKHLISEGKLKKIDEIDAYQKP